MLKYSNRIYLGGSGNAEGEPGEVHEKVVASVKDAGIIELYSKKRALAKRAT
jgi:hypothetical protein